MEETGTKTRSFRYEDYNNRRVFLRSYPLRWGEEDDTNEEDRDHDKKPTTQSTKERPPIKKIILAVFQWSEEKVLVLRRFKHKVKVYVIACIPIGIKSPTALISA